MTIHYNKPELKNLRRQLRAEMTYCEKIVWRYLRGRQVAGRKFRRQYSIDNYILDFYCPQLKIAVEIDGDVHESQEQKLKDIERQREIEKYGIIFLRITNAELMENPNKAFDKIAKKIEELTSP